MVVELCSIFLKSDVSPFSLFRSSRELKVGYRNMYLCYSALAENLSGLFARAQMLYFNRDT